ncbi:MAG TPA: glycosyltransferase family 9 protein, partial [Candidatus Acidoferrum sp.]|nr:glycosyltransferase family 9 protein [Candidatus Acidoferrum sp.]
YDLVFAYGTDPGVFRYARAVGKYTVGFAQPDGAVNRLLDQVVERPRTPIHAVDDRMSLVQGAGVLQCDRKLVYRVTDEEKEEARVFLERQAAGRGVTRIGFQVAGYPKRAFRDWPTDRFIALGRQILGNLGAKILLFGDGACADKARTIGTALGPDAVMLAGKTSLRRFGALLSECAALVTTETGPLYLAFALGVPTVALLHCLTPVELIGPTAHVERHRLLQLDPPAGTECSKHLSMELIQSEQAWEALQDILGTAEGPGGVPGGAPAKERG